MHELECYCQIAKTHIFKKKKKNQESRSIDDQESNQIFASTQNP